MGLVSPNAVHWYERLSTFEKPTVRRLQINVEFTPESSPEGEACGDSQTFKQQASTVTTVYRERAEASSIHRSAFEKEHAVER